MKKYTILYCFGFVLLACNQNAPNESKTLLVENIQKEPILPEATEIWKPVILMNGFQLQILPP